MKLIALCSTGMRSAAVAALAAGIAVLTGCGSLPLPDKPQRPAQYDFGPGAVFVIEPGEAHWFESRTPCTWINVLSKRIDHACPDIVPVSAAPAA
jgi:hypothetical protein